MKFRYSGYVMLAAALGFVLVSCGKKEEQPAETSSTAQPAGQPVDTANAGSVSGTIKLDGTVPTPHKINMAAEPYCVSQHPTPVNDQEVVAGPGRHTRKRGGLRLGRHEQVFVRDARHSRHDRSKGLHVFAAHGGHDGRPDVAGE